MTVPEWEDPQFGQAHEYITWAWILLNEGLRPYVVAKTGDTSLERERDVSKILKKMVAPVVWKDHFQGTLGRSERAFANHLIEFRNRWAHQQGYSDNDVLQSLWEIYKLLGAVSATEQAEEVRQMYDGLFLLISDRKRGSDKPTGQQPTSEVAEEIKRYIDSRIKQLTSQPEGSRLVAPSISPAPDAPADTGSDTPEPAASAGVDAVTPLNRKIREPEYFINWVKAAFDKSDFDHAIECCNYAIECCNRAIRMNPDLAEELNFILVATYNHRGVAHANKGKYDRAIANYNAALKRDRHYVEAYNNRGVAYFYKGKCDQAIRNFNAALELNPNLADAYKNRGIAHAYKGDYDQAIHNYNAALERNPNLADAYNSRGVAYAYKGDYDQAIHNYNAALERNSNYVTAYNNRGIAYANKGDYDQAIDNFNAALERNPNLVDAYNHRGVAYASKGKYDRAIANYNAALKRDRHYVEAYNNRGVAHFYKGEYDKAVDNFEKAIALEPNGKFANLAQKNMEQAIRLRDRVVG